jgi:hypothetical protein
MERVTETDMGGNCSVPSDPVSGIPYAGIVIEWVISGTFCLEYADFGRYEAVSVHEFSSITTTTTTTGSRARDARGLGHGPHLNSDYGRLTSS